MFKQRSLMPFFRFFGAFMHKKAVYLQNCDIWGDIAIIWFYRKRKQRKP